MPSTLADDPNAVTQALATRDRAILALTARAEAAEARIAELLAELDQARAGMLAAADHAARVEARIDAVLMPLSTRLHESLVDGAASDRQLRRLALQLRDQTARTAIASLSPRGPAA